MRRSHMLVTLALFVLSALLFYTVGLFTIAPSRTSGNGNLGLIPMALAAPLFLVFLILWVMFLYAIVLRWALPIQLILLVLSLTGCALCINGEVQYARELVQELGGWNDPDSRLYRFSLLNQYTNTLFFNFYTFAGGMMGASVIAILTAMVGRRVRK